MAQAMPALAAAAVAARVALARLRLLAAAAAARLRTLAPRDARADAAADKNKMCEGSVHKVRGAFLLIWASVRRPRRAVVCPPRLARRWKTMGTQVAVN